MPRTQTKYNTALQAKRLKKPGKYAFGDGLYLKVAETNAGAGLSKRWYWRGVINGQRPEISIGPFPDWSLQEARDKSIEFRKAVRSGENPKTKRNGVQTEILTFEQAARRCYEEAIMPGLSNGKHSQQWIGTLESYAFPKIGDKQINEIRQEDIINLITPIWKSKHETASRTLQRIKRVFDWARPRADCALGDKMNPAIIHRDALPNLPKTEQKHHAALAYEELPALMEKLSEVDTISAYALRFHILTASRPVETRRAEWSEIDIEKRLWTVPAEKMKSRKMHQVPLSDAAIEILKAVQGLSDVLVFPSKSNPNKPMSDSTMNLLLTRIGIPRDKATVHGFRSTFRDWAEDKTDFSHEVKEMALAHTIKNKAEAAYRRTPLLEKRRDLMNAWAEFATND